MCMTCVQQRQACACSVEMLGITPPGRASDRTFYLGKRQLRPVQATKTEIVHMPRRNG